MRRAEEIGKAQSLCTRDESRIGCVAVKGGQEVASGYNGVVGDIMPCATRGFCIRKHRNIPSGTQREVAYCICAEQRMICESARDGINLDGAEVYSSHMPCAVCVRLLIDCGITRVYYKSERYVNQFAQELATEAGFPLIGI